MIKQHVDDTIWTRTITTSIKKWKWMNEWMNVFVPKLQFIENVNEDQR